MVLMMDSVTRFARPRIGLSVGEPPTTRGYAYGILRCRRCWARRRVGRFDYGFTVR